MKLLAFSGTGHWHDQAHRVAKRASLARLSVELGTFAIERDRIDTIDDVANIEVEVTVVTIVSSVRVRKMIVELAFNWVYDRGR